MGQHDGQGAPGDRERYTRIAAQWLRRAWQAPDPRLMGGARDMVATVERALRQRSRRVRAVRWTTRARTGATAVAAAAGIVVVLRGALRSSHPAAPATAAMGGPAGSRKAEAFRRAGRAGASLDPRRLVLADGGGLPSPLEPGEHVSASRGQPVRITSSEGTELILESGASLTVMEVGPTRRFALLGGAVRAHVHELRPGDRFLIDTADVEVEVHGTRFRVETGVKTERLCEAPARRVRAGRAPRVRAVATQVSVQSGIVAVRSGGREDRLFADDTWPVPASCTASGAPPRTSAPGRLQPDVARGRQARAPEPASPADGPPAAAAGTAPAEGSDLAAQNDLFSAAVAARRAGQVGRALDLYQRLVDRFPDSSLVEGALAARMRLFAGRNDGRAPQAAAAYLARFPDGFARGEARALIQAAER